MRRIASALGSLILNCLFISAALAQGPGQLSPGELWGNPGASRAPASPTNISALAQLGVLTTYYVNASAANDAASCLTISAPCKTLPGAWNKAATSNHGTSGSLISVADGTYTDALVINGAWNGAGQISIVGNCTTPGNVIYSVSGVSNFTVTNAFVNISCMELRNNNFVELLALSGGNITWTKLRFGATTADQMQANGGRIYGSGNYSILGNIGSHGHAFNRGMISIDSAVVTLVGTPAIGNFFFGINDATVNFTNSSFAGTATGLRFLVHNSGSFNSNGAISLTGLPGSVAGILETGGRYDSFFVGDNLPWPAYAPNIASQTVGGTLATYTLNNATYKCNGKTCTARADVTVANQGVGAGGTVNIDLPFAAGGTAAVPGSSYQYLPTAKSGACFVGNLATKMTCIDSTGTTYITTGVSFVGSATYEIP